jgi:hypothetical protein
MGKKEKPHFFFCIKKSIIKEKEKRREKYV